MLLFLCTTQNTPKHIEIIKKIYVLEIDQSLLLRYVTRIWIKALACHIVDKRSEYYCERNTSLYSACSPYNNIDFSVFGRNSLK